MKIGPALVLVGLSLIVSVGLIYKSEVDRMENLQTAYNAGYTAGHAAGKASVAKPDVARMCVGWWFAADSKVDRHKEARRAYCKT